MPTRFLAALMTLSMLVALPIAALADRDDHGGRHYGWQHDQRHRFWDRDHHRWYYDEHRTWDPDRYHWVRDRSGNYVLIHLSL